MGSPEKQLGEALRLGMEKHDEFDQISPPL
jgi:hypothetical protein